MVLENTSPERIEELVLKQRAFFATGTTRDVDWRRFQLKQLLELHGEEDFDVAVPTVGDNTVLAPNTTVHDVQSITRKLANMADEKLKGTTDPQLNYRLEMRVYIDYAGKYVEEVWSKTY